MVRGSILIGGADDLLYLPQSLHELPFIRTRNKFPWRTARDDRLNLLEGKDRRTRQTLMNCYLKVNLERFVASGFGTDVARQIWREEVPVV